MSESKFCLLSNTFFCLHLWFFSVSCFCAFRLKARRTPHTAEIVRAPASLNTTGRRPAATTTAAGNSTTVMQLDDDEREGDGDGDGLAIQSVAVAGHRAVRPAAVIIDTSRLSVPKAEGKHTCFVVVLLLL